MKKSYWQTIYIDSDDAKDAVKSWFAPMCDEMTPYKAEVLCDVETDREKKLRAFMIDADGKKYRVGRTRGGRAFAITMQPLTTKARP